MTTETMDTSLNAPLTAMRRSRGQWQDGAVRNVTRFAAWLVLLLLVGIGLSLVLGGWQAAKTFGPAFLWTDVWNPVKETYGGLVPIFGTLITSLIAMVIGIPLSFGIAIFLTELCPAWLKRPLSVAVELLAAVPSIIYGMWGLFVFAPFFRDNVEPLLIGSLGQIPGIGALFAGPPLGIGILTAGIILAIMVLPFITAVVRDVFETVPPMLKESGYGLGMTTWEVVRSIVIPHTRAGIVGGVMLGLGRAMGETMAVTFVIGNAHRISASLLAPGNTISSALANEFTEAISDLYVSSLVLLGFILFVITFIVLSLAKLMLARVERRAGK
ncbi:MAG: phosphate ABC transporter permease subunit PstC [Rhodospirillales bacterium]